MYSSVTLFLCGLAMCPLWRLLGNDIITSYQHPNQFFFFFLLAPALALTGFS